MPKFGEYWYCRERDLCVNCWKPANGYARCDNCRAKHHLGERGRARPHRESAESPFPVRTFDHAVAPGGVWPKGGSRYVRPGYDVTVKLGDKKKLREADNAWAKAKRKSNG